MPDSANHDNQSLQSNSLFSEYENLWGWHAAVSGEGQDGGLGKVLPQRVVNIGQTPKGSGHNPELLELQEHWDTALRGFGFLVVLSGARGWIE